MNKSILLLAAVVAVGCSGGPGVNEPITLKLSPKEGERYSFEVNTDGGETQTKMDISVVIQKVEPDKITSVAQLDSMLSNGKEPPSLIYEPLKKMRIYNTMDSTGKVLTSRTVDGPETASGAVGANAVSYPTKPVKVGDTWEGITQTIGKGVHAKYKLASIEDVDGKRLATIEVTPDAQEGSTLEGPIVVQVEVSNGMLYSMAMKSKAKTQAGDVMLTVDMKRK